MVSGVKRRLLRLRRQLTPAKALLLLIATIGAALIAFTLLNPKAPTSLSQCTQPEERIPPLIRAAAIQPAKGHGSAAGSRLSFVSNNDTVAAALVDLRSVLRFRQHGMQQGDGEGQSGASHRQQHLQRRRQQQQQKEAQVLLRILEDAGEANKGQGSSSNHQNQNDDGVQFEHGTASWPVTQEQAQMYCTAKQHLDAEGGVTRIDEARWLRMLRSKDRTAGALSRSKPDPQQHPQPNEQDKEGLTPHSRTYWQRLQAVAHGRLSACHRNARVLEALSGLAVTLEPLQAAISGAIMPVGVAAADAATPPGAKIRAAMCMSSPAAARKCHSGRPVVSPWHPSVRNASLILASRSLGLTDDADAWLQHISSSLNTNGLLAFHDTYFAGKDPATCILSDALYAPDTDPSLVRVTEHTLGTLFAAFDVEWHRDSRVSLHPSLRCEKREVFALLRKRSLASSPRQRSPAPSAPRSQTSVHRIDPTVTTLRALAHALLTAAVRAGQHGQKSPDTATDTDGDGGGSIHDDNALRRLEEDSWLIAAVRARLGLGEGRGSMHAQRSVKHEQRQRQTQEPVHQPPPRQQEAFNVQREEDERLAGERRAASAADENALLAALQRPRRWAANGILHDTMSLEEGYRAVAKVLAQPPGAECDPTATICNVFFVWTSHRDTWSFLNRVSVESALHTFPLARVIVVSNTLPVTFFNALAGAHRVYVWRFVPDLLLASVPGASWLDAAQQAHGPHLTTHQSDFLRYAVLYRHGGLFSDTDFMWLDSAPLHHAIGGNFLGRIDSRPIMDACPWCVHRRWYLANGVLRFQAGHPVLGAVLRQIEGMPYDRDDRLAIGPHLVTKTYVAMSDPTVTLLEEHVLFPISGPDVLRFMQATAQRSHLQALLNAAAVHVFEATYKDAPYAPSSAIQQLLQLLPRLQAEPVCECVWQTEGGKLCLPYSATTRYHRGRQHDTMARLCVKIKGLHAGGALRSPPSNDGSGGDSGGGGGDGEAPVGDGASTGAKHTAPAAPANPAAMTTGLPQDGVLVLDAWLGKVQTLYQPAAKRITIPLYRDMRVEEQLELAQLWYVHERNYCNDHVSVSVILADGTAYARGSIDVMAPCLGVTPSKRRQLHARHSEDHFSWSQAAQMLRCTRFSSLYARPEPLMFWPAAYKDLVRQTTNAVTTRHAHGYDGNGGGVHASVGDRKVRRGNGRGDPQSKDNSNSYSSNSNSNSRRNAQPRAQERGHEDEHGADKQGSRAQPQPQPQPQRFKVGLVVVATGWYYAFLDDFISSAEEFFLQGHEVHYFVFTDNRPFAAGPAQRMHMLRQPVYGWPFDSMFRYQSILRQRHAFEGMDFLFLMDSDLVFVRPVGEEILGETVGVAQSFAFGIPQGAYPLETDSDSAAFVRSGGSACYFAGGIFGGTLEGAVRIMQHTAWLMEWDLMRDVDALHDDESHLNRVFASNPPEVVLPASYVYPEPPCDRAWAAGGRRYDHTYPVRILNVGCRKMLGRQPNLGRVAQLAPATAWDFLHNESLTEPRPSILMLQEDKNAHDQKKQQKAGRGKAKEKQEEREERDEQAVEEQEGHGGDAKDAPPMSMLPSPSFTREAAPHGPVCVAEPINVRNEVEAGVEEGELTDPEIKRQKLEKKREHKARRCDADKRLAYTAEPEATRPPLWLVSCLDTTTLTNTRARLHSHSHSHSHSARAEASTGQDWIESVLEAPEMLLQHTVYAHVVYGLSRPLALRFWEAQQGRPHPLALSVVEVERCDARAATALLARVPAQTVIVVDGGLVPGWQLNTQAWHAMLERQDIGLWTSQQQNARRDGKASSANSNSRGARDGTLHVAAVCPLPRAAHWKGMDLGEGEGGELACGWSPAGVAQRADTDTQRYKMGAERQRSQGVLSTTFRTYVCNPVGVRDIGDHQGFLARTQTLRQALKAASGATAAGHGHGEERQGGRPVPGFARTLLSVLVSRGSSENVEAASCFTDMQPLLRRAWALPCGGDGGSTTTLLWAAVAAAAVATFIVLNAARRGCLRIPHIRLPAPLLKLYHRS